MQHMQKPTHWKEESLLSSWSGAKNKPISPSELFLSWLAATPISFPRLLSFPSSRPIHRLRAGFAQPLKPFFPQENSPVCLSHQLPACPEPLQEPTEAGQALVSLCWPSFSMCQARDQQFFEFFSHKTSCDHTLANGCGSNSLMVTYLQSDYEQILMEMLLPGVTTSALLSSNSNARPS